MPYADTDFFLALFKATDWLKTNARALLAQHEGKLRTSLATLIELLLLSKRYNLAIDEILTGVAQIATVPERDLALAQQAAGYMSEKNLTTFDALHAVAAAGEPIISSDKAFERAGLDRIPLEAAA